MQFGEGSSSRRLDSKDLPSVRRLGKGFSGFLYETKWKGTKFVRKDFPLGSVHHDVFEQEAKALLDLHHPNIVSCPRYTVGKSSCSLLLEYVDGDLQNMIQKKVEAQGKGNQTGSSTPLLSRALDLEETRNLMLSKAKERKIAEGEPTAPFELHEAVEIIVAIASGVKYLHDNGIVHGDLKPKNVLVGEDGIVKLVDFGLVETKKRIKMVSKRTRHYEILMWKAPELFEKLLGPVTEDSDDPFTDSDTDSDEEIGSSMSDSTRRLADVYSFGFVCSQILGGKRMYSNLSLTQLRKQRIGGFVPQLPSTCPEVLRHLIFASVDRDPCRRPTFTEIYGDLKAFQSNLRPPITEGHDARTDELLTPRSYKARVRAVASAWAQAAEAAEAAAAAGAVDGAWAVAEASAAAGAVDGARAVAVAGMSTARAVAVAGMVAWMVAWAWTWAVDQALRDILSLDLVLSLGLVLSLVLGLVLGLVLAIIRARAQAQFQARFLGPSSGPRSELGPKPK